MEGLRPAISAAVASAYAPRGPEVCAANGLPAAERSQDLAEGEAPADASCVVSFGYVFVKSRGAQGPL